MTNKRYIHIHKSLDIQETTEKLMLGPLPAASPTPQWGQKQSVILSFVLVPPSAPKFLSKILRFTQHQHKICSKSEPAKQGAVCSNVLVLSEKSNGKSRMTKTKTAENNS